MGAKLLQNPPVIDQRRQFNFHDHFVEWTSGKTWTQTLGGAGSAPTISASGLDGVLSLAVTGASANDSTYNATTNPIFKWASNIPVAAEILLQFTESSTNNAMVCFGLSSTVTAGLMADTTGALPSSFSGALIYKVPGSTKWQVLSSQSTTQNSTTTKYTAGQTAYTRLRIECRMVAGTSMEVVYFIDQGAGMEQMKDNSSRQLPIKDVITLSSPAAMKLVMGVKNGTTSAETLLVDYAGAWALNSNFVASA